MKPKNFSLPVTFNPKALCGVCFKGNNYFCIFCKSSFDDILISDLQDHLLICHPKLEEKQLLNVTERCENKEVSLIESFSNFYFQIDEFENPYARPILRNISPFFNRHPHHFFAHVWYL
jgi:hypothetical protein